MKDRFAIAVGRAIECARKQAGLSRVELGERVHVDAMAIALFVGGDVPVTVDMLARIATACGARPWSMLKAAHAFYEHPHLKTIEIERFQ